MTHLRKSFYVSSLLAILSMIAVGLFLIPSYALYAPVVATVAFLSMFLVQLYSYNVQVIESPVPTYRLSIGLTFILVYYVLGAFTVIPIVVLTNIKGELISTLILLAIIYAAGYFTAPEYEEEIIL